MSTQSALEEPPAGLRGRAPVQGVKGQSNPLKLKDLSFRTSTGSSTGTLPVCEPIMGVWWLCPQ